MANGHITNEAPPDKKRKRELDDADDVAEITPKKGKLADTTTTEDGVTKEQSLTITDSGNGVIEID